jgi:hypothetical protein
MKPITLIALIAVILIFGRLIYLHQFYLDLKNILPSAVAEEYIPASSIPGAKMNCIKESKNPEMYTCEHRKAFCIVLSPGGQAQLQCKFY